MLGLTSSKCEVGRIGVDGCPDKRFIMDGVAVTCIANLDEWAAIGIKRVVLCGFAVVRQGHGECRGFADFTE